MQLVLSQIIGRATLSSVMPALAQSLASSVLRETRVLIAGFASLNPQLLRIIQVVSSVAEARPLCMGLLGCIARPLYYGGFSKWDRLTRCIKLFMAPNFLRSELPSLNLGIPILYTYDCLSYASSFCLWEWSDHTAQTRWQIDIHEVYYLRSVLIDAGVCLLIY